MKVTRAQLKEIILEAISEERSFELKSEILELKFTDLIIGRGDYDTGVIATYRDIQEGSASRTPDDPIKVCWIREENKFLITDGYHRLVEKVLRKQNTFLCEIDWAGYTLKWNIPSPKDRITGMEDIFKLTESKIRDLARKDLLREIKNGETK